MMEIDMENRSRAYYRHHRERCINRKKKIAKSYWNYKFDGQYSKGKIHCSCWMCSGKRWAHGLSMADRRKYDRDNYNEEYFA